MKLTKKAQFVFRLFLLRSFIILLTTKQRLFNNKQGIISNFSVRSCKHNILILFNKQNLIFKCLCVRQKKQLVFFRLFFWIFRWIILSVVSDVKFSDESFDVNFFVMFLFDKQYNGLYFKCRKRWTYLFSLKIWNSLSWTYILKRICLEPNVHLKSAMQFDLGPREIKFSV